MPTIESIICLVLAMEQCNLGVEGYVRLGNAYHIFGQIERAIKHYEQALTIAREICDQFNEGAWLSNLGLAHRDMGQIILATDSHDF